MRADKARVAVEGGSASDRRGAKARDNGAANCDPSGCPTFFVDRHPAQSPPPAFLLGVQRGPLIALHVACHAHSYRPVYYRTRDQRDRHATLSDVRHLFTLTRPDRAAWRSGNSEHAIPPGGGQVCDVVSSFSSS